MAARKAISKRTRFEIFKRDGFSCQYCNRKPPEVTLEVDHIDPHAGGGSDDSINLVTACWDCNRGKADKKLGEFKPRPDADLEFLSCQQEIAEAERFLKSKKRLDEVRGNLVEALQDHWHRTLEMDGNVPSGRVILEWLNRYSPEDIESGIDFFAPHLRRQPWKFKDRFDNAIKYVSAIMRNRKEEA